LIDISNANDVLYWSRDLKHGTQRLANALPKMAMAVILGIAVGLVIGMGLN